MARTKISEFSATPGDNTDIDGIDIAEGCAPSGINNAIREMMAQLKDFQAGSAGDPFNGAINGTVGATTPSTVVATQVDITAQGDLRLQDSTGGEFVALQAPATIATSYTLTLPVDDGTSGQALITDGSGVLSWSSAASGDVYGPASATDNAVARYDGTTGKIIQNSAVTIADDGATVIDVNSTSAGLRITQIGSGNALLVEDSANPDSSPIVVDANGRVIFGNTSALTIGGGTPIFQIHSTSSTQEAIAGWGTISSQSPILGFYRSASGVVGTQGAVVSGADLGAINFFGDDGTAFISAAQILAEVDGTPGTNDMPGRLLFSTTADGASSPTERMRINNSGQVLIGNTTTDASVKLLISSATGSATPTPTEFRIQTTTSASDYSTTLPWGRIGFYSSDASEGGAKTQIAIDAVASSANGGVSNLRISTATGVTGTLAERLRIGESLISLGAAPGAESLRVTPVASAVNYWNLFGNTTTGGVRFLAEGSDTDVNAVIGTKGAGIILFRTGGGLTDQFRIGHTASAVNYLQVTGGATGNAATLSAQGTDTNINIALTPKGTGVVTTNGGLSVTKTAVTAPAAADGNVFSGTYTPTLTNTLNVASSTAATCQYMRVGNVVTVSGVVNIDATATGDTAIGFSLPIASNFGSSSQCGGVFTKSFAASTNAGGIYADSTNDRAIFRIDSDTTADQSYTFTFTYRVI